MKPSTPHNPNKPLRDFALGLGVLFFASVLFGFFMPVFSTGARQFSRLLVPVLFFLVISPLILRLQVAGLRHIATFDGTPFASPALPEACLETIKLQPLGSKAPLVMVSGTRGTPVRVKFHPEGLAISAIFPWSLVAPTAYLHYDKMKIVDANWGFSPAKAIRLADGFDSEILVSRALIRKARKYSDKI